MIVASWLFRQIICLLVGDNVMAMGTGVAKSPWSGALIALASIVAVTPFAVARDWDLGSWILAIAVFVVGGIVSAVTQARRNRRLDLMVEQAREMDRVSESGQGSR